MEDGSVDRRWKWEGAVLAPPDCEPMAAEYIRRIDPDGLLLPIGIASDGTDLCREQSADPIYAVNNALPLDERRKRKNWVLVSCRYRGGYTTSMTCWTFVSSV